MAPSNSFPTTNLIVTDESPVAQPGALQMRAHSGIRKTRSTLRRGLSWTRTYDQLFSQDPSTRSLLSFLRRAWTQGLTFTIKHQMLPGSGKPPNGTGSSGVTLDAGTSGSSVGTSGWPASTSNVVRAGDWIRIDTFGAVREITSDADSDSNGNATIDINPPIATDEAPSTSEAITTTDVDIWAGIAGSLDLPQGHQNAFYINGLSIEFIEVPNA